MLVLLLLSGPDPPPTAGGRSIWRPSGRRVEGTADEPGIFGTTGSPSWKQRALYDAIKDIAGLEYSGQRVVRLATVELIGGVRLEDVLRGGVEIDLDVPREFVANRVT